MKKRKHEKQRERRTQPQEEPVPLEAFERKRETRYSNEHHRRFESPDAWLRSNDEW